MLQHLRKIMYAGTPSYNSEKLKPDQLKRLNSIGIDLPMTELRRSKGLVFILTKKNEFINLSAFDQQLHKALKQGKFLTESPYCSLAFIKPSFINSIKSPEVFIENTLPLISNYCIEYYKEKQ